MVIARIDEGGVMTTSGRWEDTLYC